MLHILVSLVCLVGLWASPVFAVNDHDMPTEREERQAWWADAWQPYVNTGCLPTVPGSGLTIGAFACTGYAGEAGQLHYIDQDSLSMTLPDATPQWLAIHRSTTATVAGWSRQGLSHYLFSTSATRPPNPDGGLVFARVDVTSPDISAITLLDVRAPGFGVSALEFGCVGDDSTDNTTCFNTIRDSGAGLVYLPEGTYQITAAVRPGAGQQWLGTVGDPNRVIIKQVTADTDAIYMDGISGVILKDLRIQGGSGAGNGLFVTSLADTAGSHRYENIRVRDAGNHGVVLQGVFNFVISNSQFNSNGADGFVCEGTPSASDTNQVADSQANGNGDDGWQIGTGDDCQNMIFSGINAEGNLDAGLQMEGSANTVTRASMEGNGGIGANFVGSFNNCYDCRTVQNECINFPTCDAPNPDGSRLGVVSNQQVILSGVSVDSGDVLSFGGGSMAAIINPSGPLCTGVGTPFDACLGGMNSGESCMGGTCPEFRTPQVVFTGSVMTHGTGTTQTVSDTQNTQDVSTTPVTIHDNMGARGSWNLVVGEDGTNRFLDMVVAANNQAPAYVQTGVTNQVTSGGTLYTLANFTDLTTYANDAATIRNNFYQIGIMLDDLTRMLRYPAGGGAAVRTYGTVGSALQGWLTSGTMDFTVQQVRRSPDPR